MVNGGCSDDCDRAFRGAAADFCDDGEVSCKIDICLCTVGEYIECFGCDKAAAVIAVAKGVYGEVWILFLSVGKCVCMVWVVVLCLVLVLLAEGCVKWWGNWQHPCFVFDVDACVGSGACKAGPLW